MAFTALMSMICVRIRRTMKPTSVSTYRSLPVRVETMKAANVRLPCLYARMACCGRRRSRAFLSRSLVDAALELRGNGSRDQAHVRNSRRWLARSRSPPSWRGTRTGSSTAMWNGSNPDLVARVRMYNAGKGTAAFSRSSFVSSGVRSRSKARCSTAAWWSKSSRSVPAKRGKFRSSSCIPS